MTFRREAKKRKERKKKFTIPENLDNKEDPKRGIHGSNVHRKQKMPKSYE